MYEVLRTLDDGRVFVDYGPASMVVTAKREDAVFPDLAKTVFPLVRDALAEIAGELERLRRHPEKEELEKLTGLPRVMAEAVYATGEKTMTPMAAVAGTVADAVADRLFALGADLVLVNNGGDIALRLGPEKTVRMGILPTLDGNISQIVSIAAGDGIGGVCTSGLGGRSLTRGVASAVTVFSARCAIADACATHIANCSYIDSPRVHVCKARDLDPESDIAELTVVHTVDALTEEELEKSQESLRREAERQRQRGNLLRCAADIQGRRLWVPA